MSAGIGRALLAAILLIVSAQTQAENWFSSLFGQSTQEQPDPRVRPDWIDNPGNGVSASAGWNPNGRAAQEELAISRARTEYAKRFGVSIMAVQQTSTTVANDRASTTAGSVAREETNQTGVKAMVKAKWRDEVNDVLWVWLVPAE